MVVPALTPLVKVRSVLPTRYLTKTQAASQLDGPVEVLQEFSQLKLNWTMAKFSKLFGPALVFLLTSCTLETAMLFPLTCIETENMTMHKKERRRRDTFCINNDDL
jgi:hypothetical protein